MKPTIFIAFLFSFSSFSKEIFLSKISTDFIKKSYQLKLVTDSKNAIQSIKTVSNKNKVKNYPVSLLGKPISLVKTAGITLVSLECKNFHPVIGCDIEIEYPSNIAIASFDKFKARLLRVRGKWKLITNNKIFSDMKLVARKVAGILVGVKKIDLK